MRIVYFGNGSRGVKCLQTLVEHREEIIAVVGHPTPESDVVATGRKLGLPVFQPEKVNDTSFADAMAELRPDLNVLAGYNQILRKRIIEIPNKGTINLHGGKLPEYRGTAPINWQIINGETTGGCSIIYVDEGIDTGDIIVQEPYEIGLEDDAATIMQKTIEIFPKLLVDVINRIKAGTVERTSQDLSEGCYYTRRFPRDGKIDWKRMTAEQVHNLVRAQVKPYSGAFCFKEGKKVKIWKTSLLSNRISGIPGRVPLSRENGVIIIAADKGLLVEQISVGDSDEAVNPMIYLKIGDDIS